MTSTEVTKQPSDARLLVVLDGITGWTKKNPRTAAVLAGLGVAGYIVFLAGAVVVNGLVMAVVTSAGFIILIRKLPKPAQNWIRDHGVISDFILSLLSYVLIGANTITGLIGAAFVGLIVSLYILWEQQQGISL